MKVRLATEDSEFSSYAEEIRKQRVQADGHHGDFKSNKRKARRRKRPGDEDEAAS